MKKNTKLKEKPKNRLLMQIIVGLVIVTMVGTTVFYSLRLIV